MANKITFIPAVILNPKAFFVSLLPPSRGRDGAPAAPSCLSLLNLSKDCISRIFRLLSIPQGPTRRHASAEARHGLLDLPKICLLRIICCLSVADACQLRLVCRALRAAVDADDTWELRLPVGYKKILEDGLSHSHSRTISYLSKKQLYRHLYEGILLNNGTLAYWVDLNAHEACFMLSARALQIVWIDDPRYWKWRPIENSRFKEGAYLERVCWFEVGGGI